MEETFRLFPIQASTFAEKLDRLYWFLIGVSGFFATLIIILVITFAVVYRRRPGRAAQATSESMGLELIWTAIPLMLVMVMFVWGSELFLDQSIPPKGAEEIFVVGKQWMWKIQHETGQREINELHVPLGRKVKLTMTTEDVLHDFSIPAFRTKADVVPGRYTYLWFEATKPGKYHLYCAEYCGLNHSGMGGWVYVMEQRDFDNWLEGNVSGQTPVEQGRDLFENKLGCASCHAGGPQQRGAKLEGIYGKEVKLVGGSSVTANDEYIKNSILNPGSQVVEGFQPIMPTFKGQVTEEQLLGLVAYIKSLSGVTAPTTRPSTAASNTAANTGSNVQTNSNSTTPRRADRGAGNAQGSNPNPPAPANR